MAYPLEGIKVLDFTRVLAGPFATRDAADKARERLKAMGLAVGNVVPK